jgi:nitrogenase molybdenum-iron protein beta chain
VLFSEDAAAIGTFIEGLSPELILGSHVEIPSAKKLGIPLFEVSSPLEQRVILARSTAGYDGAISFTEDLFSVIKDNNQ